jgi:hypothetical protein
VGFGFGAGEPCRGRRCHLPAAVVLPGLGQAHPSVGFWRIDRYFSLSSAHPSPELPGKRVTRRRRISALPDGTRFQPSRARRSIPTIPRRCDTLSDDSPLLRLPTGLDRRQVLFLDGIGYSIDMAAIGYQRLQTFLHEHTLADPEQRSHVRYALIVMDAWSIIDTVNRLRALARGTPGLKHGPAYESFRRSVSHVETLRDAVQHLYGEVEKLQDNGRPLWGSLSWVYSASPDAKTFAVGFMIPGTLAVTKGVPMVNPVGRESEIPIGLVELTAAGVTVCLSGIMRAVEQFAGRLERAATDAFAAIPDGATDHIAPLDLPYD